MRSAPLCVSSANRPRATITENGDVEPDLAALSSGFSL
jgi:hypothetical protein